MKKFKDGDLVIYAREAKCGYKSLNDYFVIGNAYKVVKGDVGTSNAYVSDGVTNWYVPETCLDPARNFDADDLKELRHDIELLRFQYEQLKKSKPREKTLSEASYEELAREMWKRCAEV